MDRIRLQRHPERTSFDQEDADAILDEAMICHIAFMDGDQPIVIPTAFGRAGDLLYIHGSPLSRMMRIVGSGAPISVSVSLLDGLVLATSAFDHSMNYRSLILFGDGRIVSDPEEKRMALDAIVDHLAPGRREHLRPMTDKEVGATSVVAIPLTEVSVKIRKGPPGRTDDDWPVWTGVIPMAQVAGSPVGDVPVPDHVEELIRARSGPNRSTS
jgi:nitroimidazol reductase NimA-like FMN-containing flavoprotein (pyridoxamine 5'-phosphate oxidase superfamily)